jgi:hypothetical protein
MLFFHAVPCHFKITVCFRILPDILDCVLRLPAAALGGVRTPFVITLQVLHV